MASESKPDAETPAAPVALHRTRAPWIGVAAGLAMAGLDTLLLSAFGVTLEMNGADARGFVAVFFGASYAVLGALIGALLEARRRDRRSGEVIRRQEAEVSATRERLAQSEKLAALGQLAAAIAHEVKNPLAVIRSSAQSLGESAGDTESQRASGFILAEIDRLTSVVDSLLAFARPIRVEVRAVDPAVLVDRALALAADDLAEHAMRIRRLMPLGLPAMRGDADLLCQVLLGLLANASAAAPGGEITVTAAGGAETVEVAIADDGPGVPSDLRARIFEPFFTTRPRGTGLGLAVAREIIEAHGGSIRVEERPGGGARFAIAIPLAAAA